MEETVLGKCVVTPDGGGEKLKMKILYFNNCWFTNVGEAFIDIGGMELSRQIFGKNVQMACISAMTDYYIKNAPEKEHRLRWTLHEHRDYDFLPFRISEYLNADYVIVPGMVGTLEFLNAPSRKMIDKLVNKGCKAIFFGLGCLKYDQNEISALREYFQRIKPALITTRDNETYEAFKDIAPCVKAIDCAFWTIDSFDPRGFVEKNYEVITFNNTNEPTELKKIKCNVVRPFHMQYEYRRENGHDYMMISDTPYDYLTLYANAERVYTDLVHATVVSIMYGTPVKSWKVDKRAQVFNALEGIECKDSWYSVPELTLQEQKRKIIKEIHSIISVG